MLAAPGFPCVTFPWPMQLPTAGFSVRGVFRRQPAVKKIVGVGCECHSCECWLLIIIIIIIIIIVIIIKPF